ncbi:MAG TPA: helix-turn-helix transcriptional regulator [Selenomonadales bacterium]|nr:helix-turn-helix transcriptional regulator [Selenomonadales bacterium]
MVIRFTAVGRRLFNGLTGEELSPNDCKQPKRNLLKEHRKRIGMSQYEVAEMFGVTQQFVSAIEANAKPIPKSILYWINGN